MKKEQKFILGFLIILVLAGLFMFCRYILAPDYFFPPPTPSSQVGRETLWGAYSGDSAASFLDFENMVGQRPDMQAVFVGWHDVFPLNTAVPLKKNNQTLVIFWEQYGTSLDQIINGSQDSYIKEFARDARSYGGEVILAPLHEMNGDWNPWSGTVGNNTPAKIVLAFQHMHDLFPADPNIKWAWVVNNESSPDTPGNQIQYYYPGDDYVDYVGADGFNFGDPWQTYNEIFSKVLLRLKSYKKPIYIFSMASAEGPGKAAWISDTLQRIKSNPDIKGWLWFNENKEKNWLVNSDSKSLEAFRDAVGP
jgi:hypothetical protein